MFIIDHKTSIITISSILCFLFLAGCSGFVKRETANEKNESETNNRFYTYKSPKDKY
jgi:predicted RND superfamily exporter protein